MELLHILNVLWRHRLVVAVGMALAAVIATLVLYHWSPPLNFEPRSIEYGAASTQILVDAGSSPLTDVGSDIEPLATRAEVFSNLVMSPPVTEAISAEAGVPAGSIAVSFQTASTGTRASQESSAEERANEIGAEGMPDRLLFAAEDGLPIITVFSQAKDGVRAERLADAGAQGLITYLDRLGADTPSSRRTSVRQLGPAEGSMVNSGASMQLALLAFVGLSILWMGVVVVSSNVLGAYRQASAPPARGSLDLAPVPEDEYEPLAAEPLRIPSGFRAAE